MENENTEKLKAAIQEAHQLNAQAMRTLEAALQAAGRDFELVGDYRYQYAMRLLNAQTKPHNVGVKFIMADTKKAFAARRKAAKAGK